MTQYNFEAIGTTWQIDLYNTLSPEEEINILACIKERIAVFDHAYSRFRNDSIVTQMSQQAGVYTLPEDAQLMLSVYSDLYTRTQGLFTPLVGNLLSDAGYDAQYSLRQKKELQVPPSWDEALEYHHPTLLIKKPVLLDFGAGGKGYLVDLVGQVLETNGILAYCIDAGGDMLHKNTTSLSVGLENPENTNEVFGVYAIANGSICGSAGNRRAWGTFTHIMNPHTKTSPRDILAVWVVAQTALVADALTTCLFFVDAQTLVSAYTFEYLLVRSDYSIERSAGFFGELFVSTPKVV
jgi:thiamine biosynthesis lipoprotein